MKFTFFAQAFILFQTLTLEALKKEIAPLPIKVENKIKLLNEYEALMKKSPVMEVRFNEKIYRKARDKTITKKGKAYIENKSFRWEAGEETWVYNGKDLYQYDPMSKYAIHYKGMDKKKEIDDLVELITDLKALQKKYSPIKETLNKDTLVVSFENKQKGDVEKLEITLVKKNESIETKEKLGNKWVTKIEMKAFVIMEKLIFLYKGGNETTFVFDSFNVLSKPNPDFLSIPKDVKIKEF